MTDLSHLNSLNARRSRQIGQLASATTNAQRELRAVWLAQTEKEIAAELSFLGIDEQPIEMSADEILRELGL